jgi:alpha-beta hydrolase superfamily lysophospholipase
LVSEIGKLLSEPLRTYFKSKKLLDLERPVKSIFIDHRNLKLHLTVFKSDEKDPCVVFVHGMGLHTMFFSGFLSKLCDAGFNVLGLDIQGHGRSGGERGHFTMQEATENVSSVIDYVTKNYDNRVGVMGISLGGMITFYSVANDPRICTAICCGIAHPRIPLRRGTTRMLLGVAAKLMPKKRLSLLKIVPLEKVTKDPDLQNVIMTDELVVSEYTFKTVTSFMKIQTKIPFDKIKTPIMIMVGEKEEITPPEYCEKVYDMLTGEKKLVVVPDAGHMLFLEYVPKTLPLVTDWFSKTLKI